jgi:tRNA G46 methylase TrmB
MIHRDTLQLLPTVINVGSRAVAKKTKINGGKYFKKKFKNTESGARSFNNEMLAEQLFGEQIWKVPIISRGPLWFISPLLPKKKRLDIIAPKLGEQTRFEIARQAIALLFDIFFTGYAHRDFNVKNLFWIDDQPHDQLKLVDFEFLDSYPKGKRPAFPLAYDITGQGLESPAFKGNMAYTSVQHPKFSLHHVLGISPEHALEEFRKDLKRELRQACETFKTRRKRHRCGSGKIYSSFKLPFFSVEPHEAQRNSVVRFECFGIRREDLYGKRILDIGSGIGGMLFTAQQYKPLISLGIEYDADKTVIAKKIAAYNGLNNVKFIQADIDQVNVSYLGGPFDVVAWQ